MAVEDGVDASEEVSICRSRRTCSSRGNSTHAAISASSGVADGMTALVVSVLLMDRDIAQNH